ncbi:DUF1648 domain-containing protein [Georgenia sp. 311]|uniref:DUF1648 domain-containing protein n=1 Tax=Georgenia sp. 311 TaxID=2585134 RepID=UPI001112C2C5|nr:DUF1648 domain-containing protein [Georgenia sp. 311]TNC18583.1 DUF1648 domain-containing protein [Georgenia sp. 311]
MTTRPPHRTRAWLLGVLLPVVITAAAWVVVAALLPRLPDPVALHWGLDGVDRTGSVGELVASTGVISAISLVIMGTLAVLTGRQAITRRMTLGLATGLATLFAGMTLSTVLVQVDAASAFDAASPDASLTVSLVAAVALGALAGALAGSDPAQPATGELPAGALVADLPEGQRAVWVRSVAGIGQTTTWVLATCAVLLGVGFWLLSDMIFPVVVLAPVVVLMLTMTTWQVQVDARGLSARGALGWPRLHVPATEVERAEVTQVNPFAEFGGWGMRTTVSGTVGVVVRKGEAIAVERSGGRRIVVTVDDAATGAALLNTYAQRARTTHPAY